MAVGVDFDPDLEHRTMRSPEAADFPSGSGVVHDDLQVATALAKRERLRELARDHSDGIQDVDNSRCEKLLGLLEGRNGDALRPGSNLRLYDRQALGGLDVRAEAHPKGGHARLHALDVAPHALCVDKRGGRTEFLNCGHGVLSI